MAKILCQTPSTEPQCCDDKVSLRDFILLLPETLSRCSGNLKEKPVLELLSRLELKREEWIQYVRFPDKSKNYTRNLISTDGKAYTLLMLYWNPDKMSLIHDHPCDGCWMRVYQGSVRETRYQKDKGELIKISDDVYSEGEMIYITDNMGYHQVGNPNKDKAAITLHLYSPPFDSCKVWLDPKKAKKTSMSKIVYDTVFGTPSGHNWCI